VQRRALRDLQRCGTELGVLRDRMVRGVAGADRREDERALVARFRALRPKVVLPGGDPSADGGATAGSSW
jgi:hypothetical protein